MPAPARGRLVLPIAAPATVLALLISPACRAEIKIQTTVDLRETYSDNAALSASGEGRGQFITELTPSLRLYANSPRVKGSLRMTEHLFAYSGERSDGTNRSQFQLQGDVHARLAGDFLFMDGTAMIGQQSVSAFGPQANANSYSSANRARISTWSISPYLRHRFGRSADTELRVTHDSLASGAVGFGDSTANAVAFSASNADQTRRVGWNLRASRQDVSFSQGAQTKTHEENFLAGTYLRANERFRLNFTGGYDSYSFDSKGTPNSGRSFSAGATWTPSSRTAIEASAGRRYYGPSYYLNATHRSRRTAWVASYSDAVTNTRSQMLIPKFIDTAGLLDSLFISSIPDPVARRQAVDAYIRANGLSPTQPDGTYNYLSNRFQLQKQMLLSSAFSTSRITALASLNALRRTSLSPSEADVILLGDRAQLNDDTRQVGATGSLNYRVTARSSASMSVSRNRSDSLSTGIRNYQTRLTMGASSQLQRKLRGSIELRRSRGNASTFGAATYRENAVSATLSLQM